MELLSNTRIKNKIIIIIFIVGALSTITGSMINYFYQVQQSKDQLVSNTILQAKLMSEYCGLPLEFNYPENATEALKKLHSIPVVYDGVLFTSNDSVFASYHKSKSTINRIPDKLKKSAYFIEGNYIHVNQPVVYKGKTYGTLYLRSFIDWRDIFSTHLLTSLTIITIMLIVIFILAYVLHRSISEPIVKLTEKMNIVANNKDYSVQFQEIGKDEIGELYTGFNTMLHEIKKRETDLETTFKSLKLSENRFRYLIEKVPIPLSVVNKEGHFTFINEKFVQVLGYTAADLPSVKEWWLKAYPDEEYRKSVIATWEAAMQKAEQGNGDIEPLEYNVVCKNGSKRIFEISGITLGNSVITTIIDHTERKHAEEELIKAKENAEESDRLKSAFLANMSHEIRTPMNGILGFTDLLKEPNLTGEEQQEYIDIIQKSGDRMLNIINDIISISKIESGMVEVSLSDTNVNEQIEYIYTFFKPECTQKGIALFHKNALPKEASIIKTDREKVYAILTNLVKNAIKFTNTGSIEFGYEKKGKYLEYFVKDTGTGISEEHREIIFERFRQSSESYTRNYEGAGLGLSISKAFAEMLGGKIWAESELGKGSTFYFTIPYITEPEETNANKTVVPALETDHHIKNLKILIAEDDKVSALFVTKAVQLFSKAVFKANTGVEAVDLCRSNPDIDLILMDINMPEMDGFEAARQIRKFNPNVTIIAQTAYALTGYKEKAIESGCNDYISKPINKEELMTLIEKYFNN
jgi:PAS domain S-box-containing protein